MNFEMIPVNSPAKMVGLFDFKSAFNSFYEELTANNS